MRILYLSLSYIPSRRASSVQVMKMCAAFARQGHEVILVAKAGVAEADVDDHARYCVEKSFTLKKIPRPSRRGGGVLYAAQMAKTLLQYRTWADVVYCRDPIGALVASLAGMPLVFEAHGMPDAAWLRTAIRRAVASSRSRGVVAITEALRTDLLESGLVGEPVMVAPDACDPPTATVRAQTGAPPVVGYVGNLYAGRGIETLIAIARQLPAYRFEIVGGQAKDLEHWRAQDVPKNVSFLGFRPQAELPELYRRFDVVVMPHATSGVFGASGRSDISRWTSPMKMFEYMGSGVALVASDLPVIREILVDGSNALLVPSEDIAAWCAAIKRLVDDPSLRTRIAQTARDQVAALYTWDARAIAIGRTLLVGQS